MGVGGGIVTEEGQSRRDHQDEAKGLEGGGEHGIGGGEDQGDEAEDNTDGETDGIAGLDGGDDDGAAGLGHVLGGDGIGEVGLDEFEFRIVFGTGGKGELVVDDAVDGGDDDRHCDEEQEDAEFPHDRVVYQI